MNGLQGIYGPSQKFVQNIVCVYTVWRKRPMILIRVSNRTNVTGHKTLSLSFPIPRRFSLWLFCLFVFFNHASSLHCANWASLCKWVQMRGPTVCSETLGLITNDIPFHSHMRPILVWILSYKIIGQIYWIHFKPPMISEIPPWWGIICVLFCFVLKNKLCMKNAQIYRTPSFLTTTSGFIMLSGYKRRKGYMTSITITLNILLMMSLYAPNR